MANSTTCKRCGGAVDSSSPHATNKKFCSRKCNKTWFNEVRSGKVTRGEWAERRYGAVPQRQLSDVERAWLAAMLDAEGTIGIYRHKIAKTRSGFKYIPTVSMSNTHQGLVEHFLSITDCWSTFRAASVRNEHHKPQWKVEIKHRNLREFLPQILPYLIAKRRQAELLLEFLRDVEAAPMRTSSTHEKFEKYWTETLALNKRGR
jgi:hypothetical protein